MIAALQVSVRAVPPQEGAYLRWRIAQALNRQGDSESALEIVEELLAESTTPEGLKPFLLFEKARLFNVLGNVEGAIDTLQQFLAGDPGPLAPRGYYELARLYRKLPSTEKAVEAYWQAIQRASAPEAEAWLWELGDYLTSLSRMEEALHAYNTLVGQTSRVDNKARALLKVGQLRLQRGERSQALRALVQVLELATNTRGGKRPARVQRQAVPAAYEALRLLLANAYPVDDYTRGVIDVEVGAYAAAARVLVRYLDTVEPHFGDAHMYLARALERLGNLAGALDQWDTLIATHPECACWGEAWFNKARIYRQQGRWDQVRQLLRRLEEHPRASPELRERAGLQRAEVLVRQGDVRSALSLYRRLVDEAVQANVRYRSALSATVLAYEWEPELGLQVARAALAQGPPPVWADPLRYWEGKLLLALGHRAEAVAVWRELAGRRPLSYYAFRAAERLEELGVEPGPWRSGERVRVGASLNTVALHRLPDIATEYGLSSGVVSLLEKGTAYAAIGLYPTADEYFRQAINMMQSPKALLRLGEAFTALGMPHLGMQAALQFLKVTQTPLAQAPEEVWRLLYPLPARSFVEQVAAVYSVEPALLFAMMRQESRFVPWAKSPAQAQGVMQLLPETARYVARRMGMPQAAEALHRPVWNIPLGTFYFADALRQFDGQVPVALAAYNAGPGNAARWFRQWGTDVDVFLERIPFLETRTYLREVQRQAAIYRSLYYCATPSC